MGEVPLQTGSDQNEKRSSQPSMTTGTWLIWAAILLAQNFMFTFVSRARNSGSLWRHAVASIGSNGVWFLSQTIIFAKLYKVMTGEYGTAMAIFTCGFYTAFTVAGSLLAHYVALRTERGKSAVGASSKYAQITPAEWEAVQRRLERLHDSA